MAKFFEVLKGDEHLVVHETTVDAHKAAGWSVVGPAPEPKAPKPEKNDSIEPPAEPKAKDKPGKKDKPVEPPADVPEEPKE